MPFLELDRISMFYTDQGDASAPPMLLVHGWGGDGGQWAPLLPHLDADLRAIVPDLRGHGASRSKGPAEPGARAAAGGGLSPPPPPGPAPPRLLPARDPARAPAVGHSLGGQVVPALAVEPPGLVRALAVLDPAYGADDEEMA